MSFSKDDVMLLRQSLEYKIAAMDIKGTDGTITKALTVLRVEFEAFVNKMD